ncbi:hypothetical protein WAI453_011873 [Rhynchosporium graminicola]
MNFGAFHHHHFADNSTTDRPAAQPASSRASLLYLRVRIDHLIDLSTFNLGNEYGLLSTILLNNPYCYTFWPAHFGRLALISLSTSVNHSLASHSVCDTGCVAFGLVSFNTAELSNRREEE